MREVTGEVGRKFAEAGCNEAPNTSTTRRNGAAISRWRRACGVFVAAMVGAAYAAVPFYNWFCRATGFGGTTQVAAAAPAQILDRRITVRFDANVTGGLPWRFSRTRRRSTSGSARSSTVGYTVVNELTRETVGEASYNVAPPTIGAYFTKINCFCFTEQRLKPGEKRDMKVVFFVDPGAREGCRAGRSQHHHPFLHDVPGARIAAAASGEFSTCPRSKLMHRRI